MSPYLTEAAVAAGLDPAVWPAGHPLMDLLRENAAEQAGRSLINRLRPAHALAVAGALGPEDNMTRQILAEARGGQFGDTGLLNDDIWAIMTLLAARVPPADARLQDAASFLLSNQASDGGWSWMAGGPSESDETGMALEALAALGRLNSTVADRALAFIAVQTYVAGGVALVRPGPPNCDSTIWSIRAHGAAGRVLPQRGWQFLRGLHNADGSFNFSEGGRPAAICTAEAATLLGLAIAKGWDVDGYGGGSAKPAPGMAAPLLALALALPAARVRGLPGAFGKA